MNLYCNCLLCCYLFRLFHFSPIRSQLSTLCHFNSGEENSRSWIRVPPGVGVLICQFYLLLLKYHRSFSLHLPKREDSPLSHCVIRCRLEKIETMMILKKRKLNWQMRTPIPVGTLIQHRGSTSLLLKWHNVDRWLRIGEKWKRRKIEQQRRRPQERFIFNSRYLNILICASTPWTVCLCLPLMKIGSYNLFKNHPTPSRMPLYTLEEIVQTA